MACTRKKRCVLGAGIAILLLCAASAPADPARGWNLNDSGETPGVELTLAADRKAKGKDRSYRPLLVLSCRDGALRAFVRTGIPAQPEHGDDRTVFLRLDDEPRFTVKMTEAQAGHVLVFDSPVMVASRLLQHETLSFGFMPRESPPTRVEFDTRGLDQAIQPLLEACGLIETEEGIRGR